MPLEHTILENLVPAQENQYEMFSCTLIIDYYNIFLSHTTQNYFKYYTAHSSYFP